MSTCADNEDIDVQLEVLKPFSELEVRPGGTHGGRALINLCSKSLLTSGYQLTLC